MLPSTLHIPTACGSTVYLVQGDPVLRDRIADDLRSTGLSVQCYPSPQAFISAAPADPRGCLLLDLHFSELNTRSTQASLLVTAMPMPIVLLVGTYCPPSSARAIKAIAIDFIASPFEPHSVLESVNYACGDDASRCELDRRFALMRSHFTGLTNREKQVLALVSEGLMNKQIAAALNLSVITVKVHRGTMMKKMRCRRLVELVRAADALNVQSDSWYRIQCARRVNRTAAAVT